MKIKSSRLYVALSVFANLAFIVVAGHAYAAEQLFTNQPSMMPELAKNGEFQVGVQTIEVTNPDQLNLTDFTSKKDRELKLEVWYPADVTDDAMLTTYEDVTRAHQAFSVQGEAYRDAPALSSGEFPLVVLSHGYTGYRTIMFYMGEHLASHGYVVVGIDHTDSTNAHVDFETNPGGGFVSTLLNRSRDQQFVLEHFSKIDSPVGRILDADNASVVGYSMGGYGAVNTVGGCYDFKAQGLQRIGFPEALAKSLVPLFNFCNAGRSEVDSRWKAMAAFAPWGQELNVHQADSLAKITVPTLYIAGDEDDIVGYENGVKKLFEQTSAENNYLMVFENARHNFAPHPAPAVAYETDFEIGHYIEPAWSNEILTRINEHMVLAFLDCHVKSDQKRCDYLPKRQDITQVKQADGKLTEPWPGFADRWGTGVQFYRGK